MILWYKIQQSILCFQNKIHACSHYKYAKKFEPVHLSQTSVANCLICYVVLFSHIIVHCELMSKYVLSFHVSSVQ